MHVLKGSIVKVFILGKDFTNSVYTVRSWEGVSCRNGPIYTYLILKVFPGILLRPRDVFTPTFVFLMLLTTTSLEFSSLHLLI